MSGALKPKQNIYIYFLKEYPRQTITVIFAFVCAAISEMIGIGIVLPVITAVIDSRQASSGNILTSYAQAFFSYIGLQNALGTMLAFMVAVIVTKAVIIFTAMRYVSYVATDISKSLRINLIHALMHAKWSYYSSIPVGKISNMLSNEAQRAGNCYLLAGKTVSSLFQMLVYVAAAFVVSWQITLLAVVFGGVFVFSLKKIVRMARSSGQEMSASLNKLLSRMGDSLVMVKPIKAMAEEERFVALLESDTQEIVSAQRKQYISNQLLQVIYEPVIITVMSVGLFVMMTYSDMPVPEILLLAFLFHRLMNYANLSQNNYQNTIQNENAVRELINQSAQAYEWAEEVPNISDCAQDIDFNDKICFDHVSFGYDDCNVLEDFSGEILAKKINLIFGPSGVGKSSLLDMITGMNKARSGVISIDGRNISEIDIKLWREKIGYVPQETILLHNSIKQNITLGSDKYSDDQVLDALENCDLRAFVEALPEGIQTSVGERGTALSGGQRQRIALARALIRKPDILIMDEATTGLDKQSETFILKTIKALAEKITIIMISHDPNIKAIADHSIILSK